MSAFKCSTTWITRICGKACCEQSKCRWQFCKTMITSDCEVPDCAVMLTAFRTQLLGQLQPIERTNGSYRMNQWSTNSQVKPSRLLRRLLRELANKPSHIEPLEYLNTWNLSLAKGLQIAQEQVDGLWLEFGSASGRSTAQIADSLNYGTRVYSFDSFRGLPEGWRRNFPRGTFNRHGRPPFTDPRVNWVVGRFNDTLSRFVREHNHEKISFVHVDCDLFSSTELVFHNIEHALSPRAVLVFDDLLNFPGYTRGELLAFEHMLVRSRRRFKVIAMTSTHILADDARLDHMFREYGEGMMSFLFPQQAVLQLV